jgi:hypothetical protein
VNDKRLPDVSCGANVLAESLALPLRITFETVVIQARFAYGHDLGVPGQSDQLLDRGFIFFLVIGVHAHRSKNLPVLFGQGQNLREVPEVHADAQGMADPVVLHQGKYFTQLSGQVGKIQVAMGVD